MARQDATRQRSAVAPSLRAELDDTVTQVAGSQDEPGMAVGAAKEETANQAALRDDLFQSLLVLIVRRVRFAFQAAPSFLMQLPVSIALITVLADAQGPVIARRVAVAAALTSDWQTSKRIRQSAVTPDPTGTPVVSTTTASAPMPTAVKAPAALATAPAAPAESAVPAFALPYRGARTMSPTIDEIHTTTTPKGTG